jgi:phosphohistidine phosphatase
MLRLLLLRHAKSDRPPGMADELRPLSERGRAAARLMGGYIAHHGLVPKLVLCSPARRTRDTLAEAAKNWPEDVSFVVADRLYLASAKVILSVIREQKVQALPLLLVGHNPGLHEAADLLVASGDVELRERLREKFPTGALAVIDFAASSWSRIHDQSGRLERYVTPREIAAATS